MLTLHENARLSRRQLLKVGSLGLGGLTLPSLLAARAAAGASGVGGKSVIFVFQQGGPPQFETYDPKPDAPSDIRTVTGITRTVLPGVHFGDTFKQLARIANKFTVVRSHSHNDNGHATGYHYVMTGRRPTFADGEHPIPTNELYPSLGSMVARELGSSGGTVPPYINMPHPMGAGGPGFFGAEYAPFVIEADPSQPDFEVKDLGQLEGLSAARQARRQRMLAGLEKDRQRAGRAAAMSTYYSKAYDLITSPAARRAFNVREEPEKLRENYGLTQIGQSALLARRLVEAGCRFVGVDAPGWDVHFNCFPSLEGDLIPPADRAFAALVNDLEARGMLDSTLVVMMGEMGRTPRVNAQAGRDHWSMAQCILFAGGGTRPGQIIGATDKQAAAPTRDPISVADLLHTVCSLLGIDSHKTYDDPLGRPVPLVDGGKMIPGLLA